MPWTTPHTWVDGEMTAALLNTHLRDNTNYLFDVPCFRVHFGSTQLCPINTYTGLSFNHPSDGIDLTAFLNGVTMLSFFPGRITLDRGGVWHFDVTVDIDDPIGQSCLIYVRDHTNSKNIGVSSVVQLDALPDGCSGQLSIDALMDEGVEVEAGVIPINLTNPTEITTGDSWTPIFTGYWIRDAP